MTVSSIGVGSGLDAETIITKLMAAESQPLNALKTKEAGLQSKVSLFGKVQSLYADLQSSARDLATLVSTAYNDPTLRELSTSPSHFVEVGNRTLQFNNTNRLVSNPSWQIGLQKTGYISEAGRCLVMQAVIANKPVIIVDRKSVV